MLSFMTALWIVLSGCSWIVLLYGLYKGRGLNYQGSYGNLNFLYLVLGSTAFAVLLVLTCVYFENYNIKY